jgi:hypothetical protein
MLREKRLKFKFCLDTTYTKHARMHQSENTLGD